MAVPEWMNAIGRFVFRFLFPPHHRKITKTVIAIGAALTLDSYLLNGLIALLIQSQLAELIGAAPPAWDGTENANGIWAGVLLIGMSLLYSIGVLAIETAAQKSSLADAAISKAASASETQHVLRRDRPIYQEFIEEFGTNLSLEDFVCRHDFGITWQKESTVLLNGFVVKWSAPEQQFQHFEIGEAFRPLLESMSQLIGHLWTKSSYLSVNPDRNCFLDPSIHNDFDIPEPISTAIDEANRLGTQIKDQRRLFIELAERNFANLPI